MISFSLIIEFEPVHITIAKVEFMLEDSSFAIMCVVAIAIVRLMELC